MVPLLNPLVWYLAVSSCLLDRPDGRHQAGPSAGKPHVLRARKAYVN
jgi:hypothetical protein